MRAATSRSTEPAVELFTSSQPASQDASAMGAVTIRRPAGPPARLHERADASIPTDVAPAIDAAMTEVGAMTR